jgi:hypothetical protein
MRFKLSRELCYMSGLAGRTHWPERSRVGIRTTNSAVEERFVEYAVGLGVLPNRMVVAYEGSFVTAYFYHSKIARMVREVMGMRSNLAGKKNGLAEAFIAGTFDANGHVLPDTINIRGLQGSDILLLERMGIHTSGGRVRNISALVALIKGMSVVLGQSKLSGA